MIQINALPGEIGVLVQVNKIQPPAVFGQCVLEYKGELFGISGAGRVENQRAVSHGGIPP